MGWFSAFVVFAMVWAMVMLMLLQVGLITQGDRGARLHGTHASAPEGFRLAPRLWLATAIAVPIWGLLVWLITSGLVTIDTLRWLTGHEGRPA